MKCRSCLIKQCERHVDNRVGFVIDQRRKHTLVYSIQPMRVQKSLATKLMPKWMDVVAVTNAAEKRQGRRRLAVASDRTKLADGVEIFSQKPIPDPLPISYPQSSNRHRKRRKLGCFERDCGCPYYVVRGCHVRQ